MSYSVHIRCPFRPSLFIHLALRAYEADGMVFPIFNQLTTSFHSKRVHGGCNCCPHVILTALQVGFCVLSPGFWDQLYI